MNIFVNDEAGYLAWVQQNFNGWVANADKARLIPNYPLVHRASHALLSSPTKSNYTTDRYIKACSDDVAELEAWSLNGYGKPGNLVRNLCTERCCDCRHCCEAERHLDRCRAARIGSCLSGNEAQRRGRHPICQKTLYEARYQPSSAGLLWHSSTEYRIESTRVL